jgi:hypothetical protein
MKRYERWALVVLLAITAASLVMGLHAISRSFTSVAKWIATTGLLTTIAGVIQLEISGLFEKVMEHYGNEGSYPYGPPSHITRQIIDNPDRPVVTWLRNTLFFNVKTGFWLIVSGTATQAVAVWL